ncbi:alpha-1,2-mannosidase, putative [Amycolatopsis pretoriensis]|uniref:Alpha-1,2-mannosidase, putative n=1 Tax=Amycolatopsis pretoriensis TaxID=218821 RepID=A0A1H5RC65_9PSEU|nr:GH92 family glycosyl hydrolase [Amycolatopsis pretoriensis]SEF35985.1 alpha-1,2-mannosidase, putative [Amycolatopsis pretoriensis]
MRRVVTAALVIPLFTAVAATPAAAHETDLASYVNPFVGAKAGDTPETNTYAGDTFPGADVPFGMVQWSPDTPLQPKPPAGQGRYYARDRDGGYAWEENKLRGFSLTHFNGAGCGGAAGDVPFLPFAGNITTSPAVDATKYFPTFSHANESASPGYYKVTTDSGITTELTATQRSGLGRFTFPKDSPATLLIDVAQSAMGSDDASVTVDPANRTVSGWVSSGHFCRGPNTYKLYFSASFDQPFTTSGTWQDAVVTPGGTSARGGDLSKTTWDKQVVTADGGSGAYLTFDPAKPVQVRVGVSYVDAQGARLNSLLEQRHDSFDTVKARARQAWNDRLRQITVEGGTDAATRTFCTALYHTLLQPNVFSDVDGRYAGFDKKIHLTKPGHAQYANFSGWDTYRDEVQLLSMLAPHEAADMAQSMLNQADQAGGIWDRWSQNNDFMGVMGGDPYHSIIASTYAFGATDFDASHALKSMVTGATRVQQAGERALERPGLSDYLALGYHPNNVSDMLEDTTADFGIAQLAQRLGASDTYHHFMSRAQYWENVYNPATGYLQTRLRDGQFLSPFDPAKYEEMRYQEGNAAQYTWMVPYDVRGLFDAMGGDDAAKKRLDFFFTKLNSDASSPYAFMSNEPSFEVPWEYAYAGAPAKTQDIVRRSAELLFKPTEDGLPGNDDLGATSAWYVFAALGMYPEAPGRAEMVLASPMFPKITLTRATGQQITITAPGASSSVKYVQALRVNGKSSTKPWLPESFAVNGGRLDFTLGASPTSWGSGASDVPPSFRDGEVPVRGRVGPGRVVVAPGSATTATVIAEGITGGGTVTWQAKPPAGITVTPSSGTLTVGAHGSASQQVRVTAAAGTQDAYTSVPVEFGGQVPAQLPVTVGTPGSLHAANTNVGVTDDKFVQYGDFGETDLYPGQFAYSAQGLAASGVTPGAKVREFTWPSSPAGAPDNVIASGQTLAVNAAKGATKLSFLGSATGGDAQGTVTVTYTDGTTLAAPLGLSEWLLRGGEETPQFGNTVVASVPYVNSAFPRYMFRLSRPYTSYLFATAPVALDPAKQVRSITLPTSTGAGQAHIFTFAVS